MSSFNNIEKFVYTKNKDDVVSLLEYIIFNDERNREKYIVFKFQNNLDQILNAIRFEITQYNQLGDMIVKSIVEFNPNNVKGYTSFVPDAKFKAHADCAKITINLERAVFERVYYENDKLNPITYTKNDFRKDFSKDNQKNKNEVKVKEAAPKIKTRDKQAKNNKRKYKIKDITKANKSKFAVVMAVVFSVLVIGYFIGFGIYGKNTLDVFTIDGIDYREIDDETVAISGYESSNKHVVIPETILEKNVVEIEANAFEGSDIVSITFSSNIDIENEAFKDCKYLSQIHNGDYVKFVGNSAFENCISLSSINFKNAIHVGNKAFAGCIGIKVFNLEEAIVYSEAFLGTEPAEITLKSTNPNKFVKLFGDVKKTPSTLRKIVIGQTYFPSGYCQGLDSVYQFVTTANNPTFEEGALEGIHSYDIRDGFAMLNDKIVGVDPNCTNFTIGYFINDIDGAFNALKAAPKIDSLRLSGINGSYSAKHFNNISVDTLVISSDCGYVEDNALQRLQAKNIVFEGYFESVRCFGDEFASATRIEHIGSVVSEEQFKPFTYATEIYVHSDVYSIPYSAFSNNISLQTLSIPVTDYFDLSYFGVTTNVRTINIIPGHFNYLPSNAINGYYNLRTLNIDPFYYEAYDNFISYCSSLETLILPCLWYSGTPIGHGMYSLKDVVISSLGDYGSYSMVNRSYMYTVNLTLNTNYSYLTNNYFANSTALETLTINDIGIWYDYNFLGGISLSTLDVINFQPSLSNAFNIGDRIGTIIVREGSFAFSQAKGIVCDRLVLDMDVNYISFDNNIDCKEIYLEQLKPSSSVIFETSFSKYFNGTIYCPEIACSSLKDLCNKYPDIKYQEGSSYLR